MFYVYRFVKNNEVIYVGKTYSMDLRMYEHKNKPFYKECDKIEYVEFEDEMNQSFYEILIINKFKPKYNKKDLYNTSFEIKDPKENEWKIYDGLNVYKQFYENNVKIFDIFDGIGITNEKVNKSDCARSLYLSNKGRNFNISSCGTLILSKTQLEEFIKILIKKYKLNIF